MSATAPQADAPCATTPTICGRDGSVANRRAIPPELTRLDTLIDWSDPLSLPAPAAVHALLHPGDHLPRHLLDRLDPETVLIECDLYWPPADLVQIEPRLRTLARLLRDATDLRRALVRSALVARLIDAGVPAAEPIGRAALPDRTEATCPAR